MPIFNDTLVNFYSTINKAVVSSIRMTQQPFIELVFRNPLFYFTVSLKPLVTVLPSASLTIT